MSELSSIKIYAKKNSVPIMQDEGSDFICKYILENDVKSVLEIGTAIGYSTIKFASVKEDVQVTSVEMDIDRHIKAKQNVSDAGLEDSITLILADAGKLELDEKFDLIFIDGPKAQYIKFFEKYKHNLNENGVIVTDNLSFHGMVEDLTLIHNYSTKKLVKKIQKYIEFLENNTEFETVFYNFGDKIAVSRKISR